MGDFVCQSLTMKVVAALVTIALHQAAADWSGSGEFSCYGHVSTDVTSPEGGDHLGEGTLNCNIIEWGGGPLGPEAMFFKPNGGAEFEICARDRSGTRGMTWALAIALLTKLRRASPAVATVIVLETLCALAAEPVQTSSNIEQRIFSYFL